ncbi:MAG: hypothetical protein JO372_18285 [Solirubrobacterales bacterium]|nr:hypothetical protein [Solirubrobacterales bacterium]
MSFGCYFFSGPEYIRVARDATGAGFITAGGYPAPISDWGWGSFGENGIDAALYSGPKWYFFSGSQYIRVTRPETDLGSTKDLGTTDPGYPASISEWGWGTFGENGIDAALYSGPVDYFFSGNEYIRVTRGEPGAGPVDPGYPASISEWGWGTFGENGIDAALYSQTKCYFFAGPSYIRVTRGETGAGTVDAGYPTTIASDWDWGSFGENGISAALYSGQTVPDSGGGGGTGNKNGDPGDSNGGPRHADFSGQRRRRWTTSLAVERIQAVSVQQRSEHSFSWWHQGVMLFDRDYAWTEHFDEYVEAASGSWLDQSRSGGVTYIAPGGAVFNSENAPLTFEVHDARPPVEQDADSVGEFDLRVLAGVVVIEESGGGGGRKELPVPMGAWRARWSGFGERALEGLEASGDAIQDPRPDRYLLQVWPTDAPGPVTRLRG